MGKIGVGMIGARFAADLHVRAFEKLRGQKLEIIAVCSKNRESAEAFAKKFEISNAFTDYRQMLERKDIQVVDLCVTTNLHHTIAIHAAEAGKHIICEKPLTGYFGEGGISRQMMMEGALKNASSVLKAVKKNRVKFCYAENFVYAPPLTKLKGLMKSGQPIRAKSVIGDVGHLTKIESFRKEPKKWMVDSWVDVEDWSAVLITFEDGSKASVHSTDVSLGAVKNLISVYLSNAVAQININPNNSLVVYSPEGNIFGSEYITEKVETNAGRQFPSPSEDWMRGYPQEMEDFIKAILEDREPVSGIDLAYETVEIIYAAYLSAETGRRVELIKNYKRIH